MVNPNDKQTLNDIIYLTGLRPFPLILTHIEYEKCMKNFFETVRETEKLLKEINHEEKRTGRRRKFMGSVRKRA